MSGALSYHAGFSAEAAVERHYERCGHRVLERRWRGRGGEVDLILADGDGLVFVEVKRSKTFDGAVARISQRQVSRIYNAAQEYSERMPKGGLTDMRFDAALVNGIGEVKVLENALVM